MMRRKLSVTALVPLSAAVLVLAACSASAAPKFPDPPPEPAATAGTQVAVLAGGCFWGMEGVFERIRGVTDVVSGYSGGKKETAKYELVGTGTTGHAESVRISYDPSVVSYGTLLKVYFAVAHDPTQLNYQGPDHGTQYRSAIFYANDAQKKEAEEYISLLSKARVYARPIVTQLVPLQGFYEAEDYHQDFMRKNPSYPYIVYWDLPKVAELEETFPDLLAKN